MSLLKNKQKSFEKIDTVDNNEGVNKFKPTESSTYAVTTSKSKHLGATASEDTLCTDKKSFISIHSTDQLCHLADYEGIAIPQCNLEILSVNRVFPSTSEESLIDDKGKVTEKPGHSKSYAPTNSKSVMSAREKVDLSELEGQSGYSDIHIPRNTMLVIGSNPGEPKMSYADPPKKISKTMKKFLRQVEKQSIKGGKQAFNKLSAMRGILKDGKCVPECTGDSAQDNTDTSSKDFTYPMDYHAYDKNNDKNVTFNTQVVIIHFSGDLCVGQSVEGLSKEKDQQARNTELRRTFLTKFNDSFQRY